MLTHCCAAQMNMTHRLLSANLDLSFSVKVLPASSGVTTDFAAAVVEAQRTSHLSNPLLAALAQHARAAAAGPDCSAVLGSDNSIDMQFTAAPTVSVNDAERLMTVSGTLSIIVATADRAVAAALQDTGSATSAIPFLDCTASALSGLAAGEPAVLDALSESASVYAAVRGAGAPAFAIEAMSAGDLVWTVSSCADGDVREITILGLSSAMQQDMVVQAASFPGFSDNTGVRRPTSAQLQTGAE